MRNIEISFVSAVMLFAVCGSAAAIKLSETTGVQGEPFGGVRAKSAQPAAVSLQSRNAAVLQPEVRAFIASYAKTDEQKKSLTNYALAEQVIVDNRGVVENPVRLAERQMLMLDCMISVAGIPWMTRLI